MGLPTVPDSVTPATLGSILNQLGLNPKLTIAVQITASAVNAQVVALDDNGVLIRSSGDSVIHNISIPVQGAEPAADPAESP